MPRGDKSSYTDKQKRQAAHIEAGYEKRGIGEEEAERRAWATVNKTAGGGKKGGSGRGKAENKAPARKGGHLGGGAAASRPAGTRGAGAARRNRRDPMDCMWTTVAIRRAGETPAAPPAEYPDPAPREAPPPDGGEIPDRRPPEQLPPLDPELPSPMPPGPEVPPPGQPG